MAAQRLDELDSEFEVEPVRQKRLQRDDNLLKSSSQTPSSSKSLPSRTFFEQERDKEDWKTRRYHLLSLDAYSRHKLLVNQYLLSKGQGVEHFTRDSSRDRNDYDILQEQHKFVWDTNDEPDTWEKRLAKTYYDKLFKEYAITDLSRYKERLLALRWRTEKEVIVGKGQFICGSKHCEETVELASWEVNFGYVEHGEKKNSLVKVRLCDNCSKKLNSCRKCHRVSKRKGKSKKRTKKKHSHKKRKYSKPSSDSQRQVSDSSSDSSDVEQSSSASTETHNEGNIWNEPVDVPQEKPQEEQFDDYFKDMFL
jgi:protein FRA10AC1